MYEKQFCRSRTHYVDQYYVIMNANLNSRVYSIVSCCAFFALHMHKSEKNTAMSIEHTNNVYTPTD